MKQTPGHSVLPVCTCQIFLLADRVKFLIAARCYILPWFVLQISIKRWKLIQMASGHHHNFGHSWWTPRLLFDCFTTCKSVAATCAFHLSRSHGDCWGTMDLETLSLHLILSSTSLRALQNLNPVHRKK